MLFDDQKLVWSGSMVSPAPPATMASNSRVCWYLAKNAPVSSRSAWISTPTLRQASCAIVTIADRSLLLELVESRNENRVPSFVRMPSEPGVQPACASRFFAASTLYARSGTPLLYAHETDGSDECST